MTALPAPVQRPMPTLCIEAAAFWSPTLPSWPHARAAFRGDAPGLEPPAPRPAATLLPPAERRRAPDSVVLALEVAAAAVAQSGRPAGELLSVFTSCHGDLAITDAICRTLATQPTLMSPTRFHNSVHNAASGYWGIATACRQASTAVTGFDASFAVGLLEALTQAAAEQRPVLLVGVDVAACGALASVNASRGLLAVALVIAPVTAPRQQPNALAALDWSLAAGSTERTQPGSEAALPLSSNAMADALPFFEALAADADRAWHMPLSSTLAIALRLRAFDRGAPSPPGILPR